MANIPLIFLILLALLIGALALAFGRLLRGPHLLDRAMALDFMAVIVVGLLGLYAVATNQQSYLDVAMVVALLGFLATIGFTSYVQRAAEK